MKVELLMPTVAQTCVPFGRRGYGSHSGTVPRVGRGHLYYKNSSHRSTSAWADENDVTWSEAQAMPPMGDTDDKSHTPS